MLPLRGLATPDDSPNQIPPFNSDLILSFFLLLIHVFALAAAGARAGAGRARPDGRLLPQPSRLVLPERGAPFFARFLSCSIKSMMGLLCAQTSCLAICSTGPPRMWCTLLSAAIKCIYRCPTDGSLYRLAAVCVKSCSCAAATVILVHHFFNRRITSFPQSMF